MANLRKLLASALSGSDLSESPTGESALDRVRALAFADRLGGQLWRLKWAHDPGAYKPALDLLARRLRKQHEPREMVERVAGVVLREYLDELCRACGGRGRIVADGTPAGGHACVPCLGTGVRRHSDAQRMRDTGLTHAQYPKWEQRFARAHAILAVADRRAWQEVAEQLERVVGKAGVREKVMGFARGRGTMLEASAPPAQNSNNERVHGGGSAAGAQREHHAGAA